MYLPKPILGTLAALASLAVTGVASTARADSLGATLSGTWGSGDISAGYGMHAQLLYCTASELAQAGTQVCEASLPNGTCMVWNELYPSCAGLGATKGYGKASAYVTGSVTVFGTTESITVTPSATTADGQSTLNLTVTAFGLTLLNESKSSISLDYGPSFGAHKDFSIVGISVKVQAEASAVIGGTLSGSVIDDGIELTMTPTITAGLDASADVSVLCASAGIEGSVDVLDLELPTTLSVAFSGGKLTYDVDSDFTYSALSGSLKADACACGACASTTICKYDGWSGDIPVFSQSGSLSL